MRFTDFYGGSGDDDDYAGDLLTQHSKQHKHFLLLFLLGAVHLFYENEMKRRT